MAVCTCSMRHFIFHEAKSIVDQFGQISIAVNGLSLAKIKASIWGMRLEISIF